VGPHPGRMAMDLTFEADRAAEERCDDEPERDVDLLPNLHAASLWPLATPQASAFAARSTCWTSHVLPSGSWNVKKVS